MRIVFDPAKRDRTLRERGLDFADAAALFESRHITAVDDRRDYGEARLLAYGWLGGQAVAVVWTERSDTRRIILMRQMHKWEIEHVGLD